MQVIESNDTQKEGVAKTSYTSELLSQGQLSEEEEFVVKWTAASLYSGGADTVGISILFLNVILY